MLVLKKGVSGVDIDELNELYLKNAPQDGVPLTSFDWNKTSEGYQFWSFVNSIATVVKSPVDKTREQLGVLPNKLQFVISRELDRVPHRNSSKLLRFAFKWEESPQGKEYWSLVRDLIQYYSDESSTVQYQPSASNGHQESAASNRTGV